MTRIAYLTASCMMPGAANARDDAWEHGLQFRALSPACAARGIELREVVWDDPELDPSAWDAFVVGTTWDYQERSHAFLARLEEIAASRPLWNDLATLRWNLDKGYLRELEARGVGIVPTIFTDRVDEHALEQAFARFETDDLVAKPVVGAGAWRQVRVRRGEALPPREELPPDGAVMLQPFLPAVQEEGEYSFLFFGGTFSHCACKRPGAGDYRVQSIYGGHELVHDARDEDIAACRAVLGAVDVDLLYARVDMIRGPSGDLLLMELELVEPYFYPEQGPELGAHFSRALEDALNRSSRR